MTELQARHTKTQIANIPQTKDSVMKKSFCIEIVSDFDLWYNTMGIDSYSHTCKVNGKKRMYFYDTSKHDIYKKLINIFGVFGEIPQIVEVYETTQTMQKSRTF